MAGGHHEAEVQALFRRAELVVGMPRGSSVVRHTSELFIVKPHIGRRIRRVLSVHLATGLDLIDAVAEGYPGIAPLLANQWGSIRIRQGSWGLWCGLCTSPVDPRQDVAALASALGVASYVIDWGPGTEWDVSQRTAVLLWETDQSPPYRELPRLALAIENCAPKRLGGKNADQVSHLSQSDTDST